jgi:RNA polymerase sigma-70 factor (ECF subfamily)
MMEGRLRIMGPDDEPMPPMERQSAFEAALGEHRRIVFKVATIYGRTAEDRSDLAQEITLQLWRAFGGFDPRRGKLSTWMYRIALNVAISYARRPSWKAAERSGPLEDHHLATLGASPRAAPDDRVAALHAVIDQLAPLDRALILLYLEERSHAEIGGILGLSETNVATKLNRLKHTLRTRMIAKGA